MTTEQREAIDRLNKDKNKSLACGDITIVNIADLDTALSLIKEQEIYINKSNNITEEMNRDIKKLISEIKQKDKQIDLIIDEFYKKAKISTKCYLQKSVEKCMKHKNCKECIKQYFEIKVKNVESKR